MRGIPVWISWLKYVSFIYWGWNLLLKVRCGVQGRRAAGHVGRRLAGAHAQASVCPYLFLHAVKHSASNDAREDSALRRARGCSRSVACC